MEPDRIGPLDGLSVRPRPASRLLVIDAENRLLLFDTEIVYTRVWLTPGGGANDGESFEAAALRELWEETGLRDVELGPCIWTTNFRFRHLDTIYEQHERYFIVRVPSLELSRDNWEATEKNEIKEHRWWTLDEITASNASFRPRNLGELLAPLLLGEYPVEPHEVLIEANAILET